MSRQWPDPPGGHAGAVRVALFRVDGEPKGAGSKVAGVATRWNPQERRREVVLRDNGMPQTFTKDSSGADGARWRADVGWAARQAMGSEPPIARGTPIAVQFTFYRPRPAGHSGSGRNAGVVKPSAPPFPATRPDVLKLARAAEDAMESIAYDDDAQIVSELILKRFGRPGVEVAIWTLPDAMSDLVSPLP